MLAALAGPGARLAHAQGPASPAPPTGARVAAAGDSAAHAGAAAGADTARAATPAPADTARVAAPAAADSTSGAAGEPEIVGAITVEGNVTADADRVLISFGVASGSRYSAAAVRRGVVKLFALGLFDDVWVERKPHGEVLDLVIHVKERPRIGRIDISGNKRKETSELEKKLSMKKGDIYSPSTVQVEVDSLLKFYHDEGFARAQIHTSVDTTAVKNQVVVKFIIEEGEKLQVTGVEFIGATPELEARIKKQLKTKARGFFGGGQVKDESFEEDRQRLETWYHSQGYRDMRVVSHEFKPGDSPRHVILVVTVDEGRRYTMGNVSWKGNTIVPTVVLATNVRIRSGDRYDGSKIEHAQGQAYAAYSEQGYLSVAVEPRETVRDSVVDVTFNITEGPASNIRYINITGNKNTREKVLRRELSIHEGDRFRRSALMRTRDDLMRLGIFEDIQPDLGAGDSTDVDIILKVKEKQVGTASAGAGYTGESGLTGFVELAHNNVLGNAQSLSLHLERGAKLSNYFLSFTEPWFHDTPTLLGYSLYDNSIQRDFYTEHRKGISAKIGRPLPWPDFSRGALTYRLEAVRIDSSSIGTGITDPAVLASFTSGQTLRTSSVLLDFIRNSSDEPFYPTRGTRLVANSQFAGGPFGGDIRFNKQRLEGRFYHTSWPRHVVTMLRARFGFLGAFPNSEMPVPVYERFRLGGGATTDPLRGYDDYQVVPDKFISREVVRGAIRSIDSLTTPGVRDTTYYYGVATSRYPGGRFFATYTVEQQFPVVHPLHAVIFFDAGNTWDQFHEIRPLDLKMGAGVGFRLEIPLLGNVGFDLGYGFNRDDGPKLKGHFLLGNVSF